MRWTNLLALPALALAANSTNSTNRATFIYNSTASSTAGNALVWSINTVQSTGDVYFHLEAPASGSWVGIGFGGQMAGSLMMIAYPSSNTTGITLSPRIGTGHSEPTYASNIKVEKIWDSGLTQPNYVTTDTNIMYIDGVCRNCTSWSTGKLDLSSNTAPFIFAVGPGTDMNTDDPAAGLKRHSFYGTFTMDMTKATSQITGAVPQPINGGYQAGNATNALSTNKDNDFAPGAHAGLMILSWLIIFPLGAVILRLFDKIILHSIVQGIGTFFILVSFGLGCYVSSQYNRSKNFNSAHQIIGILLIVGLLAQLGLGIVGHRIFKKTQQPSKLAKVHLFLGPALILVAVINGGIGWKFAGSDYMVIRYAIIVIAIFIVFATLRIVAQRCVRRRRSNQLSNQPVQNAPEGYQYPQFVAPKQPYTTTVPLQTFQSNDSMPQYHQQEQHPRPMV